MTVDRRAVVEARRRTIVSTHDLVSAIDGRPAHHGCFGMHEWAMVHGLGQDEVRHLGLPLRFSPQRTAEIVEQQGVRCSHFDAFRFFTDTARGLNTQQLTRADQISSDQPGCLHVGMDLAKRCKPVGVSRGERVRYGQTHERRAPRDRCRRLRLRLHGPT